MLKQLFSIQQYYLQTRERTVAPDDVKQHQRLGWILARSVCYYRLFSLQDLPLAHRDEALAHQIRQWSPFAQFDSYIVWQDAQAQVWIWDSRQQQQAIAAEQCKVALSVPEPLLYAPPASSVERQVRLLTLADGVEAQVWQAGVLLASRWWATPPTIMAWQVFCRANHLALSDSVPTPETLPLLAQPWGKPKRQVGLTLLRQERLWVWLVSSVFIVLIIWELLLAWRWQTALQTLESEVVVLTEQSTPLLTARNRAIRDKQVAEQLMQLDTLPGQLEILASVAQTLPGGAKLVGWVYQGEQIQITVQSNFIDPRFYVKAFQELPHFTEVKTESSTQENRIIINAQLVPLSQ